MNNNIQFEINDGIAQLELGFNGAPAQPSRRQTRGTSRAAWWFRQMREVVDRAVEWTPPPPARPQQTWFANSHRECSV